MDRTGKKVLENPEIAAKILHDFDPEEHVDAVIQYEVLTNRQLQEVRAERVPYKRCDLFYNHVKFAPQGYDKLLRVFRDKELWWLADALVQERERVEKAGDVRFALDYFDQAQRTVRLEERQLMELAAHIGVRWEQVAKRLEFTDAQLYDIKVQNQMMGIDMMATRMLVQFKQREPSKANLEFLIPVLEQYDIYLEKNHVENILK